MRQAMFVAAKIRQGHYVPNLRAVVATGHRNVVL